MNLYTLPRKSVLKTSKRYIKQIDTSMFTEGQKVSYSSLKSFVSDNGKYFIVSGAAGTGKTFIISKFIESYLFDNASKKICVTAPTNKAVRVLSSMAEYKHSNISYKTIHSLLGIRMVRKEGIDVFEQKQQSELNSYELVIIDESSMLDSNLLSIITKDCNTKVIFVGDSCQLPPVENNQVYSPVFASGYEETKLTEIIRQAAKNPIIRLATQTRENSYSKDSSFDFVVMNDSDQYIKGVFQYQKKYGSELNEIKKLITHYFTSANFRDNSDFSKVLCFTNKQVDRYNAFIRKIYFDCNDLPLIVAGEKLVIKTTVKEKGNDENIIFNVNDEVEALSIFDEILKVGHYEIKYYSVLLQDVITGKEHFVNVVCEESTQTLEKVIKEISGTAKILPKFDPMKKELWSKVYEIKDFFTEVGYNYAITVHRSQGSTYTNVFVDTSDFHFIDNPIMLRKLQYTAFTRASDRLHIIF